MNNYTLFNLLFNCFIVLLYYLIVYYNIMILKPDKLDFPDWDEIINLDETSESYMSTSTILSFLNQLKKQDLICMDEIYNSLDDVIIFQHITNSLIISDDKIRNLTSKCKNTDKLIAIPIGIFTPLLPDNIGHLNLIIIDSYEKTIEYYEPFGPENNIYLNFINIPDLIVKKISNILNLKDYKYLNLSESCPIGLQKKEEVENYHCGAWCILILYLKIYNPDTRISDIEKTIIDTFKKSHNLTIFIKKFITFINTFNKNNINIKQKSYSFNLVKEYVMNDPEMLSSISEYMKKNMTRYFNKVIDKDFQMDNKYLFDFYNITSLHQTPLFHDNISSVIINALVNAYNQGREAGYNQAQEAFKRERDGNVNSMEI